MAKANHMPKNAFRQFAENERKRRILQTPIEELIARSSLGTPEAVRARARAPKALVDRVLGRADDILIVELSWPSLAPLRPADAEAANDAWGFNCGPAALCAALGMTPDEVRPHLDRFEERRFMNVNAMRAALVSIGADFTWEYLEGIEHRDPRFLPRLGIARVQWGGPWMQPRVPVPARYKRTHWVASHRDSHGAYSIFDVNVGAWCTFESWRDVVVPALLADVRRADGSWFFTHAIWLTPGEPEEKT